MIRTSASAFIFFSQLLPVRNSALKTRKRRMMEMYDRRFLLLIVILPGSIPDHFGYESDQDEQR